MCQMIAVVIFTKILLLPGLREMGLALPLAPDKLRRWRWDGCAEIPGQATAVVRVRTRCSNLFACQLQTRLRCSSPPCSQVPRVRVDRAVARAVSITADMQRGPAASRLRAGLDRRLSDLPAQCIVCTVLVPANIQTAAAGGDGSISRVAVSLTH